MAFYSILSESCLGISHTGSVTVKGEDTVELSDEEVDAIVALIREKGTTDVKRLGLKEALPKVYEKLDGAYYGMAYRAEEIHWLWEGFENGCFEYDSDELMSYCEENCGFVFEYDEEDYLDDDVLDEDSLYDDKFEAFEEWLSDYVYGLGDEEAKDFFYNHMNADLCLDDIDYSVAIPQVIIAKAKEQN